MARKDELGKQIRRARAAGGWTLRDLSARTSLTLSYLCELETGHRTNPSLETLELLADTLGTSVGRLLDEPP